MYGVERKAQTEQRRGAPRPLARSLAKLSTTRTPRASELVEAGPETNDPRGATVAVEATEAYPGGPAVVEVSRKIAGATDTDAHLRVGEDGDAELVDPAERAGVEQPEGDGSLEGEDNTSDPRKGADDPADRNDDPGAEGSPPGGESMTSERVGVAREAAPSTDGSAAGTPPAKRAPARGKGPTGT